jgi:hypothetical protein
VLINVSNQSIQLKARLEKQRRNIEESEEASQSQENASQTNSDTSQHNPNPSLIISNLSENNSKELQKQKLAQTLTQNDVKKPDSQIESDKSKFVSNSKLSLRDRSQKV